MSQLAQIPKPGSAGTTRPTPIRIGASLCLLGERVRFDGAHKRLPALIALQRGGSLRPPVEIVGVCPEVEIGMGVPRPALRLTADPHGTLMLSHPDGIDWTEAMHRYSRRRVGELQRLDLYGYVLKSKSPSCGLARVKLYPKGSNRWRRAGHGLFASELIRRMPRLPVVEEPELEDPERRAHFLRRACAYRRVQRAVASGWTAPDLTAFHASEELLLVSQHAKAHALLSGLVPEAGARARRAAAGRYADAFLDTLRAPPTRTGHLRALRLAIARLRDHLAADDRAELERLVHAYGRGALPRGAVLRAVRTQARRHPAAGLLRQSYFGPEACP